jgi:hypothetical protein
MPNPGRAFVGTRRYAILFTCSAQPPIVTKEYRHVTLTADHARNFTSCVRQASCHRPHGKLPMSSVSAWSRRSVPSRMQPRPAGLYDSPLEEAVTSEPVSGKRPEIPSQEGKIRRLGSRSNSPENGTPSGGGGSHYGILFPLITRAHARARQPASVQPHCVPTGDISIE